jgi:hypothetical protein
MLRRRLSGRQRIPRANAFTRLPSARVPTSGLEPLSCSLRVIGQALQGIAHAAYLEGFPFPALLCVAPYCAPGGIRVVSNVVRGLRVAGSFVSQMR